MDDLAEANFREANGGASQKEKIRRLFGKAGPDGRLCPQDVKLACVFILKKGGEKFW